MDDRHDPSSLFFDEESLDLYSVLGLTSEAKPDELKKAYRRLALLYHPDKHATADEDAKNAASHRFQQIGFAYAVLGDEKRKKRYDSTGKTDEGFEEGIAEDGWEAYFEDLFDRVTKEKLDDMKKEYQGSTEESADLTKAYLETDGSLDKILTFIPHSTHEDEARFIVIISALIAKGELSSLPTWERSTKDEKAKLVRKKQADKEAKEAEELARELGVWDEFYGSGKAVPRKGRGKGKGKGKQEEGEEGEDEDHSALQALILKKRKNMDGFFDSLTAKYAEPKAKGKGKRKADAEEAETPSKRKKQAAIPDPPDLDDDEFNALQQKLFGDKAKPSGEPSSPQKKKAGKGRRNK